MHDPSPTFQRPQRPAVGSPSLAEQVLLDTRVDAAHRRPLLDFSDTLELGTLDEAGARLAANAAKSLGCQVILAIREPSRKRFRLIGDSRSLEKPRRLPHGDPLEQVFAESYLLGVSSEGVFVETTFELDTPLRTELAHQLGVTWTRVSLLADSADRTQAALVVLGETDEPHGFEERLGSPESFRELAAYLRVRREAEATWWERSRTGLAATLRAKRTAAWAIAILSLAALLAIPVPHYVAADCQCEPATRRLLTAPFDAQLAESFVKPGDIVEAGQLVATFEGEEIASEMESLAAERKRIEQQYDAALAHGEAAVASEAALELQRIKSRLDIARQRMARLELRSPIDGVVVSGDLEEAIGASLAIGQRLLEIAPLEHMTAEIYVDESDVSLVSTGQPVKLRFEGASGTEFKTSLHRIFPRAEIVEGENVYVAEGEIEGDSAALAPGMRGRAQVYDGWRPLAWTLFRKPYLAVRRFWGWY